MKFIIEYNENSLFSTPRDEKEFAGRVQQIYTELEYAQKKPSKQTVNSLSLAICLLLGGLNSVEEVK